VVRYRFSDFTLSPQRRLLLRDGREVPLIPRYFDLLLLLVERRRQAVHRREIFDRVWGDVVVSDSALSQAVRTIRRTLDDDTREPRFIRTVSRHGYQFVFAEVVEEEEDPAPSATAPVAVAAGAAVSSGAAAAAPARPAPARRIARLAVMRGAAAATGGALAGLAVGGIGGLVLTVAPGSTAPLTLAPVLAVVGGSCGAIGGAGVGAGLGVVEAMSPPWRAPWLTAAAALGGGLVGGAVQWLAGWALATLLGLDLTIGGGLEGIGIGAAAGLGYAVALDRDEPPRGWQRVRGAVVAALCCGVAGLALALAGRPLASGTIHALSHAAEGSRATLAPLGRLFGEADFGPVSSRILAFVEGAGFGLGLAWALTRRWDEDPDPPSRDV
jgi:DNA-binding winged helix-turn-helix (wHTH) protein